MRKIILIAVLFLCLTIVGCSSNGGGGGAAESNTGSNTVNTTYTFKTLEEMKSFVPDGDGNIINLLGYYEAGDGAGGTFYWDSACEEADNGGTVISANGSEKGRYIRLCDTNERNVSWFGAKGNGEDDDTSAILSALTDLKNGGTLVFETGNYFVSRAIELKLDGIKLKGEGSVTLTATENMDGVIVISDASNVTVSDLKIVGNGRADSGIAVVGECENVSMKTVSIAQFSKIGLNVNGNISGGIYEEVNVVSAKPSSIGLSVGGGANDIVFTACSFDMLSAAKCVAGEFKHTHGLTFQNCTFTTKSFESSGTVFVGGENDGYPRAIGFYSCDVFNAVVNEDGGSIGKIHFYGFMTHNGQTVPNHEKIHGSTDDGKFFGIS